MDKVVHFEVPVDDLERAKAFYSSMFGWQLTDYPGMDYTGATTTPIDESFQPTEPGGINGGIVARSDEVKVPLITVGVSSIDACLDQVAAAGGGVVRAKTEIPNMGYFAYVTDSEGNTVGLWENLTP